MSALGRGLLQMWRLEEGRLAAHRVELARQLRERAVSLPPAVAVRVTAADPARAARQTLDAGFEMCRGMQSWLLLDLAYQARSLRDFAISAEVCAPTAFQSEKGLSAALDAFSSDLESLGPTDTRLILGAVALATSLGIEEDAARRMAGDSDVAVDQDRVGRASAAHVQVVFLPLAELLRGHVAALEAMHG